MAYWYVIGSLAALLTSLGFVPQILRMLRTRSVKDVSRTALIQFSLGISLWTAYGVHLGDVIIILANGVGLASLLLATGLHIYFSRRQIKKTP